MYVCMPLFVPLKFPLALSLHLPFSNPSPPLRSGHNAGVLPAVQVLSALLRQVRVSVPVNLFLCMRLSLYPSLPLSPSPPSTHTNPLPPPRYSHYFASLGGVVVMDARQSRGLYPQGIGQGQGQGQGQQSYSTLQA